MKVNLVANGARTNPHVKLVYWLASEMAKDYSMDHQKATMYFVMDGLPDLCSWIEKKYQVKATPWRFGSDDNVIGSGIDFDDNAALTKLILKVPSGNLI